MHIKTFLKSIIHQKKGDDFGYIINKPPRDNPYKYDLIYERLNRLVSNYDLKHMKKIVGLDFGINPFDLFVLESFIENNKIKKVLELGAGTSSQMLDNIGVVRNSFALESIFYDLKFKKIDIFKDYRIIEKFIRSNQVDMLVIDCEHSARMAKLIDRRFLRLLNYSKPIFIHDWYDFGRTTFAEQVYYFNNLLDKYEVTYMTDLPANIIAKLKKTNEQIDNEIFYKKLGLKSRLLPIRRCSAILTPISENKIL